MARFLVRLHSLDPLSLQLADFEPIEDPCTAVIPYLPSTEAGRHAKSVLASGAFEQGHDRRVLLHGDYWPGNVIWQDGRLVAVIDWEDAGLGDPLADLATARAELLCHHGDDAMDQFTDRYLAVHHNTIGPLSLDWLPLWELYVSASASGHYGWLGSGAGRGSSAPTTHGALLQSSCPTTRLTRIARPPIQDGTGRENRTQFSVTRRLGFRWALSTAART